MIRDRIHFLILMIFPHLLQITLPIAFATIVIRFAFPHFEHKTLFDVGFSIDLPGKLNGGGAILFPYLNTVEAYLILYILFR